MKNVLVARFFIFCSSISNNNEHLRTCSNLDPLLH